MIVSKKKLEQLVEERVNKLYTEPVIVEVEVNDLNKDEAEKVITTVKSSLEGFGYKKVMVVGTRKGTGSIRRVFI